VETASEAQRTVTAIHGERLVMSAHSRGPALDPESH
jgi:hypothetical protein